MHFVFLAVLFFFFQNIANKEYGRRFDSGVKTLFPFHVISHIAMILPLVCIGVSVKMPRIGLLYAFLYACAFLSAIMMLMKTLTLGPIGKTTLIVNLSMLLPMLLGVLFWEEKLNVYNIIGIPCVLLTLFLSVPAKSNGEKANAKWTVSVLITFLLDGLLSVIQKLFLRAVGDEYSVSFVLVSAIFGLVIAAIISLAFYLKDQKLSIPGGKNLLPFAFIAFVVGASTALATMFNMMSLTLLSGVIVFPVRQGGLILLITLYGMIRYKDKFDLKTLIMLLSGLLGIILLNL
ncbi:MAG: EamA family transporter [Clostridia bacterium]|nr:EamA family transporter [Clostridia bacterium]